jgi:hypothetical protein
VVYLLDLEKFTWYQRRTVEEAILQVDLHHRFRSATKKFRSATHKFISTTQKFRSATHKYTIQLVF